MEGFFVESGAFDGEDISNSLHFELHRHWTGLLIEPLSQEFNKLKLKHRKAFIINACISKHPYPVQVDISSVECYNILTPFCHVSRELS